MSNNLTQAQLAKLAKTIHAAKVAAEAADAAKEALKLYAAANGVDTIAAGGFIVTIKTVETKQFDSKQFKSDHADLYEQYTKTTTNTRLNIK